MAVVATGTLGTGQAQYLDVELMGGHTYAISVLPSESNVDFDLHVYDQNGQLVAWDERTTPDAYGAVTPLITGPFRIMVNSAGGMAAYRVDVVG
jgi:hypothetical protein